MGQTLLTGKLKHYALSQDNRNLQQSIQSAEKYWQNSGIYTVEIGSKTALPVLLISGLGVLHLDWQDVLAELMGEFHLVVYDRPGMGFSDPAVNMPSVSLYQEIELAREILTHHFDKPAIIVGHSMGGFIAESLARLYPELCAKLILLDSSCEFENTAKKYAETVNKIPDGYRSLSHMGVKNISDNRGEALLKTTTCSGAERFIKNPKKVLLDSVQRYISRLWCSFGIRRLIARIMFYSKPRPLLSLSNSEDRRLNLKIYSRTSALQAFLREFKSYSLWAEQREEISHSQPLSVPTVVMAAQTWGIFCFNAWGRMQRRWACQLKSDNPQTEIRFCLFRSRHLAMRSSPKTVVKAIRG